MTWLHLLPETGPAPVGVVDPAPPATPGRRPYAQPAWSGRRDSTPAPPADPAGVPLDELTGSIAWHVGLRADAPSAGTVRAWPPGIRRVVAAQVHLEAVRRDSPDEATEAALDVLVDDDIAWTRDDLGWALRTAADEWGLYDGGAFLLPALIATTLPVDELAGFGPPLQAVFDHILGNRNLTGRVRRRLRAGYGTAVGRASGVLPAHLLHHGDDFGPLVRRRLTGRLSEPPAQALLAYAATLDRGAPTRAWLRGARDVHTGPAAAVVTEVLGHLPAYPGRLHEDHDVLLRGLTWMLATGTSAAVTDLLARVAAPAAASPDGTRRPRAPRTAAAAVAALADRPGTVSIRALTEISGSVCHKALHDHVRSALDRLGAPPP